MPHARAKKLDPDRFTVFAYSALTGMVTSKQFTFMKAAIGRAKIFKQGGHPYVRVLPPLDVPIQPQVFSRLLRLSERAAVEERKARGRVREYDYIFEGMQTEPEFYTARKSRK